MSADKRDALATLGTIIDDTQGRDAIHVAVIAVRASQRLFPGQDVGVEDGEASPKAGTLVGIVDPFLKQPVQVGEWFWMLLYPRTITSLRHVWSHPALPDEPPPERKPASMHDKKAASEGWLRSFVAKADCPSYETVIATAIGEGAHQWDPDEYLHFNGQDAHGEIPDEFWDHIEVVTGRKPEHRPKYFSCGC